MNSNKIKNNNLLIYFIIILGFNLNNKFQNKTYIYINIVIFKLIF